MPAFPSFTYQHAAALKAGLALAATLLLAWQWYCARRGQMKPSRRSDASLALIGVFSFIGWWNFGAFGFGGGYFHHHEFFHYYLGAKYSTELGYTGLYDCVAAAEAQQGRRDQVANRWIRDLRTNELRPGYAVLDGAPCAGRFTSAARWDEFRHDVAWFRDRLGAEKWLNVQMDHGYNATPLWTVVGRALSNTGPIGPVQIAALWWIDPILLVAMWGVVWWAFGWRVMCVALVWWGTNYPARYNFTGGAFLRQDWLFLAVAGLCFARRGGMTAAGVALTWSALLRIFPGFIVLGLVLKALIGMGRSRRFRLEPAHRQFALGAILALAVLVPLSLTVPGENAGRFSAWKGFFDNSDKLLSTPLVNHVGLPVVVAFHPSGRSDRIREYWLDSPWDLWKETRRRVFGERRLVYLALVAGFVLLLGLAVRRAEDWVALLLGVGAIPIFTELTCYYYCILLASGFLWPRFQAAGVGLAATSLMSLLVTVAIRADDDRFTLISLFIVLFVIGVTFAVARGRRGQPVAGGAAAPASARSAT
jgi:hypothetical protein